MARRGTTRWGRAVVAAAAMVAVLTTLTPGAGAAVSAKNSAHDEMVRAKRARGYLIGDVDRYDALKAAASSYAASAADGSGATADGAPTGAAPTASPSWKGIDENDLAPPDSTGAIGPQSYVEFINIQMAIYTRSGGLIAANPFEVVTGAASHFDMSDPQVIWDTHTKRFYFVILNTADDTFFWGFSKTSHPTTVDAASWCSYTADYGYGLSLPDYPKLGQSTDFLIIGANIYANPVTYLGSDIDTITKPQTTASFTTCPAPTSFQLNRTAAILNCDGSPFASDPNPGVAAGAFNEGWVAAVPDATNSGAVGSYVDIIKVTKNPDGTPNVAPAVCVTVPSYAPPPPAPQKSFTTTVDTLDGRLKHATLAPDPRFRDATHRDGALALWTSHAVLGGAGSREDWYEIAVDGATLLQSGTVTDPNLFVFDGGISSDRRSTTKTQGFFGSNMVMGVTTSGTNADPAIQMVSKVGASPQSALVLVKQSPGAEAGFDCFENPFVPGKCRWGDYSGASADPAASTRGTKGRVWLTGMWSSGTVDPLSATWRTWNWEATP